LCNLKLDNCAIAKQDGQVTPLLPDIINFEYTHFLPEKIAECANILASKGYSSLKVGRDMVAMQQSLID
jgi:hypothetical protein